MSATGIDHARRSWCEREHGYWLNTGPDGKLWVYVAAGTFEDGAPRVLTRLATHYEAQLWADQDYGELARCLAQQGYPVKVKRRSWWRRLLGR